MFTIEKITNRMPIAANDNGAWKFITALLTAENEVFS
jgi:hypothetical protein